MHNGRWSPLRFDLYPGERRGIKGGGGYKRGRTSPIFHDFHALGEVLNEWSFCRRFIGPLVACPVSKCLGNYTASCPARKLAQSGAPHHLQLTVASQATKDGSLSRLDRDKQRLFPGAVGG